jgi:hypothetical protein
MVKVRKRLLVISLLVVLVASLSAGCIDRDVEARISPAPDGFYVVKEDFFSPEDTPYVERFGIEKGVVVEYSVCQSGGFRCKHIILHIYKFKNADSAETYREQYSRGETERFRRDGKYVAYALTTSRDEKVKQLAIDMVEYAT